MKFFHPYYEILVDTSDLNFVSLLGKLNEYYKKIPNTKCINCPGKCGVEADCCKSFSPPMLFIEFIAILKTMASLPKEKLKEVHYNCFASYLNPEQAKPCMLLKETLCSVYAQRPLACRLFGLYPKKEYEDRLDRVSKELKVSIDETPFAKQCQNIESSGTKTVPTETSQKIFENIHELDVQLFEDRAVGKYFVYGTKTYMPFDAHWLLLHIGPDELQNLTAIKLNLRDLRKSLKDGKVSKEDVDVAEEQVKEFLESIKKSINTIETPKTSE